VKFGIFLTNRLVHRRKTRNLTRLLKFAWNKIHQPSQILLVQKDYWCNNFQQLELSVQVFQNRHYSWPPWNCHLHKLNRFLNLLYCQIKILVEESLRNSQIIATVMCFFGCENWFWLCYFRKIIWPWNWYGHVWLRLSKTPQCVTACLRVRTNSTVKLFFVQKEKPMSQSK